MVKDLVVKFLALSIVAGAWGGESTFTNSTLQIGDNYAKGATLLSAQTQQFLRQVRQTAELACTNKLGPMAGSESCDTYSQGYANTARYFVDLEKNAGGELRIGEDMKMLVGKTEEGEAAKVIEIACDGTGEKDAARGVSTFNFPTQASSVVAVLHHAEKCDGVNSNTPQDGVLRIDSRNQKLCTFYFVCGAKVQGAQMRTLAREDDTTFRPNLGAPPPASPTIATLEPGMTMPPAVPSIDAAFAGSSIPPAIPSGTSGDPSSLRSWTPPDAILPSLQGYINESGLTAESLAQ